MVHVGSHVGIGGRRRRGGGAAPPLSPTTLPVSTRLIVVGDSIVNVSNAAFSAHRAWRHWLNFYAGGHFHMTAGSNQGIGGATLTSQANATAFIGRRKDWWLAQVDANTAVMFAAGTNDSANATATLAVQQSTLLAHINEVKALGGKVILAKILKGVANQSPNANPEINLTKWTLFNAWLDTLHDPAGGVFVCGSRVNAIGTTAAHLYDGLHPNGEGARLVGQADAADLAPYLASGSILFGASAPPENLEPNWDFAGTAGTAGTGASGPVATGWSVFCSSNGTAGGSAIGVTATCSKTVDANGFPAQQIDVTGTATAAGVLTLLNNVPVAGTYDELFEAFARVSLAATGGGAPAGVASIGFLLGSLGGQFSKTVDANAGDVIAAVAGVVRTVPVAGLQSNSTTNAEVSLGIKAGAVNLRLIVSQFGCRLVETAAYRAPFNLGAAMPAGLTNPIGDRPRLNGTAGVGNVLTLQPATWAGGGLTRTCRLRRNGVVIASYPPGTAPMTYTQVAADSGTTLTLEDEATNALGGPVSAVSAGVVVP